MSAYIKLTDELIRYSHRYQCVHLVKISEPVQYHIFAIVFPLKKFQVLYTRCHLYTVMSTYAVCMHKINMYVILGNSSSSSHPVIKRQS